MTSFKRTPPAVQRRENHERRTSSLAEVAAAPRLGRGESVDAPSPRRGRAIFVGSDARRSVAARRYTLTGGKVSQQFKALPDYEIVYDAIYVDLDNGYERHDVASDTAAPKRGPGSAPYQKIYRYDYHFWWDCAPDDDAVRTGAAYTRNSAGCCVTPLATQCPGNDEAAPSFQETVEVLRGAQDAGQATGPEGGSYELYTLTRPAQTYNWFFDAAGNMAYETQVVSTHGAAYNSTRTFGNWSVGVPDPALFNDTACDARAPSGQNESRPTPRRYDVSLDVVASTPRLRRTKQVASTPRLRRGSSVSMSQVLCPNVGQDVYCLDAQGPCPPHAG